ncbi:MAG: hypothetical protein ACKVHF_03270 [Candidatus Poseidoniales archaeon]|tara:strand:- start:228 stop:488 length:261 start_codon:yes stop_codon:yes gene_type:complete
MPVCNTCGMDGIIQAQCEFCGGLIIDFMVPDDLVKTDLKNGKKFENSSKLNYETMNQIFPLPFGIDNAPQYAISISIPFGIELAPK